MESGIGAVHDGFSPEVLHPTRESLQVDLAVGKPARTHSGRPGGKEHRDALRGLRKQDMPAGLTSGISSALRGLLRTTAASDVSRLSTAMERQAR